MTRSSHSQWSATGLNDAINDPVEGSPPVVVTSEADCAADAVRDNVPDKHGLVHTLEFLDGENLPVDLVHADPVTSSEGKGLPRCVLGKDLVRGVTPELSFELSGDEAPGNEESNNDHVGGHGRSFLLIQLECCSRTSRVRAFLMHTRRGLGCQVKIFSSPAKISSRVCLLVKVRFQARICSTCQ